MVISEIRLIDYIMILNFVFYSGETKASYLARNHHFTLHNWLYRVNYDNEQKYSFHLSFKYNVQEQFRVIFCVIGSNIRAHNKLYTYNRWELYNI